MIYASGYFKTKYRDDMSLVETRNRWIFLTTVLCISFFIPLIASPFILDLANQVLLALVASIALMLLTGYAGQISLGHAGLIAAGAFTTAILYKELGAPIWITLPVSAVTGAVLGLIFGLPSLRLKGLYLALSTLALHFIVTYAGSEYETKRGFATGVVIDPPTIGPFVIDDPRIWYYVMLILDIFLVIFVLNLMRTRTGRAMMAIRDRDIAAEALGINLSAYKLYAFIISSVITSIAGCLFAYYRGFVSVEAFSLLMTIEYVAMVIIGGLGSMLGVILGTIFVVILPYGIEGAVALFNVSSRFTTYIFSLNHAAFGLIMIVFLVMEPKGLVGIWERVRDYFVLWPFRYRPLGGDK